MSDLISKKTLIKEIEKISTSLLDEWDTMGVLNIVYRQPTVTGEPKGEWIDVEEFYFDYRCSSCGSLAEFRTDFCPNCGCDMRSSAE